MPKCKYCNEEGLVLSMANNDYVCEYCGEWQNATLNDVWEVVNA